MKQKPDSKTNIKSDKFRVGFIGVGQIARFMHDKVLLDDRIRDKFIVTAIFDPNPGSIREYINQRKSFSAVPCPLIESSADSLITNENVDVIAVLSPTSTHKDHVIKALTNRKPVFVEKPLCLNNAEGEEILLKSRETSLPVQTGMVLRHSKTVLNIEAITKEKRFGKLLWMQWDEHRPFAPRAWRYARKKEGDILLWDKAVHQFDLFHHIADSKISRIAGFGDQALLPRSGEPKKNLRSFNYELPLAGEGFDHIFVSMEHENMIHSNLSVSYVSPWARESKWTLQFEDAKITVFWEVPLTGTNSVVSYTYLFTDDIRHKVPWKYPMQYPPSEEHLSFVEERDEPLHHGSVSQWLSFYKALVNNEKPKCTIEEGLHAIRVAEAAFSALSEYRVVCLE